MGKDIFFPVASGVVINAGENSQNSKQFCFGYGSKVHVEDRFIALGGCACNVSIGLARLGITASALGNIGSDTDGQWIVDMLKNDTVDVQLIRTIDGAKTDISVILVDTNAGERTIFVNRDVGEKLVFGERDLKKHDWCFVGSLYGDAISDNMRVLHHAVVQKKIKLAYNPGAHNIAHDHRVVLDLVHHAEVLFVNKTEAQNIIKHFDLDIVKNSVHDEVVLIETLLSHMLSKTAIVVLTDGRRGAWVGDGRSIYHTDTIDKNVHDATGAGDAFASGFLAASLRGYDTALCAQWGSANSDAVIDYYGAQEGLLKYGIIKKRLKMFDVKKIK